MVTPNAWRKESTKDQLDIFVSSRLQECKAERVAARNAISSINHNPVLFEHLGARSTPPRSLYLSRLQDSEVMVAIYRHGYGYVDTQGGMEISGLEDEFNFAREHGIPLLLYVFADSVGREERLTQLIETASSTVTIWFYQTPDELEERIRDDVTAEITRSLTRPEVARGVLANSSEELLNRAEKRQGPLIKRTSTLNFLFSESAKHPILCLYGPPGIGKTTLSAQFANQVGGTYVRVNGLPPLSLFSVCAGAVTGRDDGVTYSTLQGAVLGFSSAWAECQNITLVIDECDFIPELLSAIESAGGTTSKKRILLTSRSAIEGLPAFEVPGLSPDEISHLLGEALPQQGAIPKTPLEVQELLYARETTNALGPVPRELLCYLAISPVPLKADELLDLLGDDTIGIEELYDQLRYIQRLIDDSPNGFRLVHDEIAASFQASITKTPQRLRFYINRLQDIFEERGDFRSLYHAASLLDDDSARTYAFAAIRQSTHVGDFRYSREITERLLEQALDAERQAEALELMLTLVYPMELLGEALKAEDLLKQAEELAARLGQEEQDRVAEVAISSRARRTLAEKDVLDLEAIRERYESNGSTWDTARIGLELSAIHIGSKSYERAVQVLRPTLEAFQEAGDEYGADLAERNLAAALAGLPGHDAEVDELAFHIEQRSSNSVDPRRQKAWYNNILSRRYRSSGRLDDAEKVTRETIELSLELGEEALTALTYVNLGNVYRDKKDVRAALDAYSKAGTYAQKCGRRDIEADSSRLASGILNDIPDSAAVVPDRFEQAKIFAEHAIGLLTNTIYHEGIARAHVELGEASFELGKRHTAAEAYFTAAKHFKLVPDEVGFEHALVRGAEYSIEEDPSFYLQEMAAIFAVPLDSDTPPGDQFISLIGPILTQAPKEFFVRLLGRHLKRVRDELPDLLKPALLEALTEAVEHLPTANKNSAGAWRPLYVGFLLPYLSQDSRGFDVHRRLSKALTRIVQGFDVRYTESGDTVWTVVMDFDTPIALTIMPLDDTQGLFAASQALALFFKAFEDEIGQIVGKTDVFEVNLQIASFDDMPDDIKEMSREMFDLENRLKEQDVCVSRPVNFDGSTPTIVFLGDKFLPRAVAGEGVGGSMQILFGLSLLEVIHQCFRGQVIDEEIRPKIVSIVRETLS